MESNKKVIGVTFAILAVIIWSGNFIISRGLSGMYSPFATAFFRWILACLIFFPFAYKKLKAEWPYIMKQKMLMVACGITGTGIYSILVYAAGRTTSATNMSLIATSAPIFTVIIMRLIYKEKIGIKKIVGIAIGMIGVVFLVLKGDIATLVNMTFTEGDLVILFATFIWAIYTIINKNKSPEISSVSFVFCGFFVGFIISIPFFLYDISTNGFPEIELIGVACFFYLAIGISIAAFLLWNKAVLYIGATNTSILYNTIPVFSCISAFLILREPIEPIQIVAMVVIFSGVVIAQDIKKKKV